MIKYPSGSFVDCTRGRGKRWNWLVCGEDGCDSERRTEAIDVKALELGWEGCRSYVMLYPQPGRGRLAQLVRAWC